MPRFADKVAVVTGGASGIGLAITKRLIAEGASVVAGDLNEANLDAIAAPALYLASADASYVSGASLLVDGAWAVSGYPDMRPFRGPVAWNGR